MEENQKSFTTGEVAKICHVSVRTVQFYDNEGIVTPSELSEGGRRIYTELDLEKFRTACLYKNLGFSLNEIKGIVASENEHAFLLDLLHAQRVKMEDQIKNLTKKRDKLSALQEEIKLNGIATISNEEELNNLLSRKRKHQKTDVMTYIFLSCYVAITVVGFILATEIGGVYPYVMVGITMVLLLGLIYYHSSVNAYICKNCGTKFVIGFFQDMFSMNGVHKGKYLKCPQCGKRAWMNETFRDEH